MKQEAWLRSLDYKVEPSHTMAGIRSGTPASRFPAKQIPAHLRLDLAEGLFRLEADWRYLLSRHVDQHNFWMPLHSDRVDFRLQLFTAGAADLADPATNGKIWAMEGLVHDAHTAEACSGLIQLERSSHRAGGSQPLWFLTAWLLDIPGSACEVRFRVPLLV